MGPSAGMPSVSMASRRRGTLVPLALMPLNPFLVHDASAMRLGARVSLALSSQAVATPDSSDKLYVDRECHFLHYPAG